MSDIFQKIKSKQLQARKTKDQIETALLTCIMGDISAVAKRDLRDVTDEDCFAVIRKYIKNNAETLNLVKQSEMAVATENAKTLEAEAAILSGLLPPQAGEKEILKALSTEFQGSNKGEAMKFLKQKFSGNYDGKVASSVVDTYFCNLKAS